MVIPIMGWADNYIKKLETDYEVSFRPRGNSMTGKIDSGQLVTVKAVTTDILQVGDIVLCKVSGRQYLHLIKQIGADGRFLIGNNKGFINGWTTANNIYGIV